MSYVTKNRNEDGGDTLVIGGKMIVEEGATVEGLGDAASGYTLPAATEDTLGGVKVGSGLSINEDGLLSANGGGVTPCESIADLGNDPTISDIVRSFNALLAAMRSVGLMKT